MKLSAKRERNVWRHVRSRAKGRFLEGHFHEIDDRRGTRKIAIGEAIR